MPFQFNTGIQSSQNVESFNAIIKRSLNSTSTLCENSLYNTSDNNFKKDIIDKPQVMLKAILNDIDISNIVET
ncbi:hypothetical protein RhiirC2_783313 [Rhizophagus irregularis]|uniref:Uncharacterized protein n=1 Tax=Rhizophagus irregularis TaxID=588596 RepID=A0A2N1N181_9GLOM|nr:hypothetical protein RhiirC2_783313 [Rhizophagus irregularis]